MSSLDCVLSSLDCALHNIIQDPTSPSPEESFEASLEQSRLESHLATPLETPLETPMESTFDLASELHKRLHVLQLPDEPHKSNTYQPPFTTTTTGSGSQHELNQSQKNARWSEFRIQATHQLSSAYTRRCASLSPMHRLRARLLHTAAHARGIAIDYGRALPCGLDTSNAGSDSIRCHEHDSTRCYCVWWVWDRDAVCMDWKPYARGRYADMRAGAPCALHGTRMCFCLWKADEGGVEAYVAYNLRKR